MRDFRAKAGSWERLVDYAELFADRSGDFWSDAMAARRAVEEVLVAVVDAREMERRRLDLSAFLDRYHQRKVLLLGDFRSGRDRLQAIAAELEALGYLPVLADTVEEFPEYDLRQKILLLALVCRFVVVEDSTPAGQLTELPLMEVARKVTVVLRRIGTQSSWMTAGMSESSNVILERRYAAGELSAVVTESVEWAESELERLGAKYDSEFPWRRPTPPAP